MAEISRETHLLAAQEFLHAVGRETTSLTPEQQANIQEAIEHIERTRKLLAETDE